jgi:hypothetical protein
VNKKVLSYITKELGFGEMLESEAKMKLFYEKKQHKKSNDALP